MEPPRATIVTGFWCMSFAYNFLYARSCEPEISETAAAAARSQSINALVAQIDAERIRAATPPGLAGAIRIWLVTHERGGWIAPTAP